MRARVLVTGADQHQGLAVVRGLGLAGIDVVAGSAERRNIGFASRFACTRALYPSPRTEPEGFVKEIVRIVEYHRVGMIIPAVESTLVVLDNHRAEIEKVCRFAAPPSGVLTTAIDKSRTIALAERLGVPAPRTIAADEVDEALAIAEAFHFPVAVKPRGHSQHLATRHLHEFKVKYARSWEELRLLLEQFRGGGTLPLIQEYAGGTGVCVSALFDQGRAVALMAYERTREVPLTGGVSVMRRTIPLNKKLKTYTVEMLKAMQWRGMAMVEFKYDRITDRYVLMEINGRFQASTALSLDAGINFPELTYRLFAELPLPADPPSYPVGIRERWLRGDTQALLLHLAGITTAEAVPEAREALPNRGTALWSYLLDFRPGTRYDEFKWYDPLPGVWEALGCANLLLIHVLKGVRAALRACFRFGRIHKNAVPDQVMAHHKKG